MKISYGAQISHSKNLKDFGFKGFEINVRQRSGGFRGKSKMTNLKEMAQQYVPPTTKNIVELDIVDVNVDINKAEYTDKDGKPFTVNEIEVDGEKYRVPTSVLAQLKKILEMKPETKNFSVGKTGEGLNTSYTVVPM